MAATVIATATAGANVANVWYRRRGIGLGLSIWTGLAPIFSSCPVKLRELRRRSMDFVRISIFDIVVVAL